MLGTRRSLDHVRTVEILIKQLSVLSEVSAFLEGRILLVQIGKVRSRLAQNVFVIWTSHII